MKEKVESTFSEGNRPGLATVLVGEDPASQTYVRIKHKACEDVGVTSKGITLPDDASFDDVAQALRDLNVDPEIDGILLQLPLPDALRPQTSTLMEIIAPDKDVDCFTRSNMGALIAGEGLFAPCTPKGIVHLLPATGESWEGKDVVIINRSVEVGKPLALLLIRENATVTVCHTRTKDIAAHTRAADVVIVGVGRVGYLTEDMVSDGAIIIDVGTNRNEEGKLVGDADFDALLPKVKLITPVPGGVGPMTVAMLMENTFIAAKNRRDKQAT
ncbi:MAG TPA: bifunctional 5,10-methylenetetrahydrofolate dehydrogenase/5,10-methenyltetrahydrofolate cyclohydrolase [Candidatus Lokiarchaeia archaeon]|nr:bifunctional 5,10-methylenetetrahydrofolate dehydrogenase/5,10-methenyltetrahydrofolate cyclohydrolase [Candidatus Lokiarchaeia archaeon]